MRQERSVAELVVKQYVKEGNVLGLGSGTLAASVIEVLAAERERGNLRAITCIPANDTAAVEAAIQGLPLSDVEQHSKVDLMFSEVDEVDRSNLACIFGRNIGGTAPVHLPIPRMRQLLASSEHMIALVDDPDKVVHRLAGDIPVFISAGDWEDTAEDLDDRFLGDAEIWRRPSKGTANPRGGDQPYLSSAGEHILEIRFDDTLRLDGNADVSYREIAEAIEEVPGVVAHGLVVRSGITAVVATPAGPQILEQMQIVASGDAAAD
ncbi:probable ribose-5-phosphate isomerase A [Coccomyxa sp. Obi]|nr:probable ribose-5-phosphate isomerase A [Coccomyxa sp. Obi]